MTHTEHYQAIAAKSSAVPTLLCGHCRSTLSRGRIFRNGERYSFDIDCHTVALCSADDCGVLNCCDEALAGLDGAADLISKAS
ncbi:hypothetical protein DIT71_11595 [Marinobacter vulgaris]|uniref:Uncharacterized protein n=1 Tax=Marinobacter vulgaris TaxID=1928331 RepID=A0A2V3ZIX7_9GAMM|nr:hypothetical protein [Marinobacter vulgaris]PXX90151.1 hypothetical protein DIT71_11595 [Marinobacter vulgaris]TSJ69825.1 hypothetical protein FPC41_13050 [Marinobacter vulgaris]